MIAFDTPLQYLKGVGPRRAADLQRVGLSTVEDLLDRFPIRTKDRGTFQTIASLRPATAASVAGEVISCGIRPTRRPRFKIFEMLVRDHTGVLRAIFFNQPFLNDVFHRTSGSSLGRLELTPHGMQMQNPPPRSEIGGRRRGLTRMTRRCTPAASCRSTRRPAR